MNSIHTTKIIIIVLSVLCLQPVYCQIILPLNTGALNNFHYSSSNTANTINWIHDVKIIQGDIFHTGYVDDGTKHPSIVKYGASGSIIWETNITCIDGVGLCVFDNPNGLLVFGEGQRINGCTDPISMFSVLVDKTTGVIINNYGLKFYNEQTLPFPPAQNGQGLTVVQRLTNNRTKFCDIKGTSGNVIGYMVCGNYMDNDFPSNSNTLQNFSNGSFLLKLDIDGKPNLSFGNQGLLLYNQNVSPKYYNSHFMSVSVNYAPASTTINGYMVVGYRNENITVQQTNSDYGTDAFIISLDANGGVIWEDIYDDVNHYKNTTMPISIPYTDNPENSVCANFATLPGLKNKNERGTRLIQDVSNGNFYVLNQNNYTLFYYPTSAPCTAVYPTSGFYVSADPAVFCISPTTGTISWVTNLNQSMGADFENDILFMANTNELLVLGATATDPPSGSSSPNNQKAVVSKLTATTGAIKYEHSFLYQTNSQTMFCPFSIYADASDCYIGGDADGASAGKDYYEIIRFQY